MGVLNFNVSKDLIQRLHKGDLTADDLIKGVLDGDIANVTKLNTALLAFHADESAYEVKAIELMPDVEYNHETLTGKVTFKYLVNFHFGCADIDRDESARETAAFEIDAEKQLLTIHIHDKISRDTIDEF